MHGCPALAGALVFVNVDTGSTARTILVMLIDFETSSWWPRGMLGDFHQNAWVMVMEYVLVCLRGS